ncbi:hypothetical protein ANN_27364 [Periplaneta americana]|uniref:Mos1 transposase HTH domain-containing protein n=1 Tax=Periplaneta americana TaxID=6978 RepID=A0ABQ8RXZ7_PERAM|nr:hypothetical protein ANN_27364 [Periplaneta americana]
MSPGSSTENYPAFAHIGLRKTRKNLNQVTCPDRDSNPGHLVSQPDALTVTPQSKNCHCRRWSAITNTVLSEDPIVDESVKVSRTQGVCYHRLRTAISSESCREYVNAVIEHPADCEMRSVIRFLNARNIKPADIHHQLCEVYGDDANSDGMVRRWVRKFNEGRISVHDEQHTDRPSLINDDLKMQEANESHLRHSHESDCTVVCLLINNDDTRGECEHINDRQPYCNSFLQFSQNIGSPTGNVIEVICQNRCLRLYLYYQAVHLTSYVSEEEQ